MTIIVVMGVSGSGKSTVARTIAAKLGWEFEEGDELHPASNVAKMAAGTPLDDDDRWPWLERIAAWIAQQRAVGRDGIITCSALKRAYRDVLRGEGVRFVFLHGSEELLADRLAHRGGHFMPPSLLESQLATLEPPAPDEDAVTVDIGGTPDEIADRAIALLRT